MYSTLFREFHLSNALTYVELHPRFHLCYEELSCYEYNIREGHLFRISQIFLLPQIYQGFHLDMYYDTFVERPHIDFS